MFSSSYYALVAGFREYTLDAETKGFELNEIIAEVKEALSASDMKVVELLYAYYDCENLINRHNASSAHNPLGQLSAEEIEEELQRPSRIIAPLAKVVRAYAAPDSEDAEDLDLSQPFAKSLMTAYYKACEGSKSRLLREWAQCDRAIRNIVAATIARAQGIAIDTVVVGEGSVVESLLRSSAADFGLRAELPYVEALVSAVSDERNFVEKERKIDNIRWAEISELSTFDYFDLNAVVAYLVKMNMVARWTSLDKKVGREMFDRLVAELDGKEMINKL